MSIAITQANYRELERKHKLIISPLMIDLQKLRTENSLMSDNYKRLKLALVSKDPNFDFARVLSQQNDGDSAAFNNNRNQRGSPGRGGQPNINVKVNVQSEEASNESDIQNMGKRLVEVQMSNIELEQDMAILRKKFRDLLTMKGIEGGPGNSKPVVASGENQDISNLMLQIAELNSEIGQYKREKESLQNQLTEQAS